jgi:cytidyltransferase-like protein
MTDSIRYDLELTPDTFSLEQILSRLPEVYRPKLKEKYLAAVKRKKVRVYADGVFDLFHLGHARIFEQVKKMFPADVEVTVIAGVCCDKDVLKYKGKFVSDKNF